MRARAINHNNIAYLDSTDWHVSSAAHDFEFSMEIVVEDMRKSVKVGNNLIMMSGGSLALHKTSWRSLAWEMERGNFSL